MTILQITYRPGPPGLVFCGYCHSAVDPTQTQTHTEVHRREQKERK